MPQISFTNLVKQPYGSWLDAAVRAGVVAFITGVTGWLAAPDLSTWKSAALGVGIGVATAVVRALQGLFTPSETPSLGKGLGA